MTRRFGGFACVDWSGEAVARPKGIAVAIAEPGDDAPRLIAPAGGWSREAVGAWLGEAAAARADLIVGFDFSFALPFADAGAYFPGWSSAPGDARALWAAIDLRCRGDPSLGCRGLVADGEVSRHFRHHRRGPGDRFGGGHGRLRTTEIACRAQGLGAAQSGFNLVGPAQVGKSSLTGMRLLHRLGDRIAIWPFDAVPTEGPLIVEIYTTIAARAAGLRGRSKVRAAEGLDRALAALGAQPHEPLQRYDDHSTDALIGAAWLRRFAGDEALWHPAGLAPVRNTEGWTFGVG